jgi:hypothetical protein
MLRTFINAGITINDDKLKKIRLWENETAFSKAYMITVTYIDTTQDNITYPTLDKRTFDFINFTKQE